MDAPELTTMAACVLVPEVIAEKESPVETAAVTKAVVASVVLFVPGACVVAVLEPNATGFANVGVPLNAILPLKVALPLNVPVPKPAPAANVGVPEKFAAPLIVVGVIVAKV
jgi:hypothetical protein